MNRQITASIQDLAPLIKQKLEEGGTVEFVVPGRSMRPTLLDRVSCVRLVKAECPRRGDMVYYQRDNGQYVLHRIIAYGRDGCYVICGDGQFEKEHGIRREQIIGVVAAFTRRHGWVGCDSVCYRCWVLLLPFLRLLRHLKASFVYRWGKFTNKTK